jgi:hypothetical protein
MKDPYRKKDVPIFGRQMAHGPRVELHGDEF